MLFNIAHLCTQENKDVKHEIGSYFLNLALCGYSNEIACIYFANAFRDKKIYIDKTNF